MFGSLLCPDAQLNGPADVSVFQVKLWIKVLLWSDGGRVGGGRILQSQILQGSESPDAVTSVWCALCAVAVSRCLVQLTPWALMCCSTVPRRDSRTFLSPRREERV